MALTLLIGLLPGLAAAGTPATVGYRDFSYGASIGRGSGDKPQSKLWFTDGTWFAGMFQPTPTSWWKIYRFDPATNDWTSTGALIDDRDDAHGDYLWIEATQTLYVASAHDTGNLRIYRFGYNAATNAWTKQLGPVEIPSGGIETATIARDTKDRLWTTWTRPDGVTGRSDVFVSSSADNGTTWDSPFVLPSQGLDRPAADDISAVVAYGSGSSAAIGIMYSKQNSGSDAMYFTSHPDSSAPTVGWTDKEIANSGPEAADDHINLKVSDSGRILAATKTGKDGNPDGSLDLILLLERTSGGTWRKHVVGVVADDQTRPQVIVDDELGAIYVLMAATEADDGGRIHVKSASFADLDAATASNPAFAPGPGALVISSAVDPKVNDPSTAKAPVTGASDLLVIASDRTTKFYLHNVLPLEAADAAGPSGAISINGGSDITNNPALTLSLTASDPGSGVSGLQVSNSPDISGAATLAPRTAMGWTLPAGDGTRTVYARWRDTVGNWSVIASDTIILDTVAAAGSVTIDGGAAEVGGSHVSVALSDPEPGNIVNVRLSNSGTLSSGLLDGGTTFAFTSPIVWTLAPGDGSRTVWAQWQDRAGNWSAPASDTIVVNEAGLAPPAGAIAINSGAAYTNAAAVTVALSKPAADVTQVRLSTAPMSGTWVAYAPSMAFSLPGLDGSKTVYAQWRDASGQVSPPASDTIVLDRTRPAVGSARQALREATAGLRALPGWVLWSGGDAGSGVGQYVVQRSVNGGPYRQVALPVVDQARLATAYTPGASYRFRVRAFDRAGNASGWVYTALVRAAAFQESSRSIGYVGRWRLASQVGAQGGRVKYSTVRGSRANLRFYGRSVALVSTVGPNRGVARIYINGLLARTVNLQSPTVRARQVVFQRTWGRPGWRTISIRVVGTAGHPRVDLDAIGILR